MTDRRRHHSRGSDDRHASSKRIHIEEENSRGRCHDDEYYEHERKRRSDKHSKKSDLDVSCSSYINAESKYQETKNSRNYDNERSCNSSSSSLSSSSLPSSASVSENVHKHTSSLNTKSEVSVNLKSLSRVINWNLYKSTLNSLFFQERGAVKYGSKDYENFWPFLEQFEAFRKKKIQSVSVGDVDSQFLYYSYSTDPAASKPNKVFEFPAKYNALYKLNMVVINKEGDKKIQNYMDTKRRRDEDCSDRSALTLHDLSKFLEVIAHYVDFLQKKKFSKLLNLRKDQNNLPIAAYRDTIEDLVENNQVVVIAGDTGCGKSTQVPQFLLNAGYRKIACTQPRRIACMSLCRRVSYETLNEYGSEVAFQVRFEKTSTSATRIVFLTEGLLLRQVNTDPSLSRYDVILIDEVHERHIHTDFLLGVVKCILHQRNSDPTCKPLKLILMSATINIDLFSCYFDPPAPVCKVPGRLHPIELNYVAPESQECRYIEKGKMEKLDCTPYLRVLQMIDKKYAVTERGDVLIFLSALTDILSLVDAVRQYNEKTHRWLPLPLHSSLSIADQDKVFDYAPDGVRKCIISTNIAETSVTIDGVRFVIDSGKVKEMRYDDKYKMERLVEQWISRASAEQRKGRAGRTGPGVCYRLYSTLDYDNLAEYSTPEIRRVPLDSLILQMLYMDLEDCHRFPFIEMPDRERIESSLVFLKEKGAIHEQNEALTPIGHILALLPVDIVIGKMLIMGSVLGESESVSTVCAALCVQSLYTSSTRDNFEIHSLRKEFISDHGDLITLLNCFNAWIRVKSSGENSRKWCKRRGLEEQRLYEMSKMRSQFRELLEQHKLISSSRHLTASRDQDESYVDKAERQRRHADRNALNRLRAERRKLCRKKKVLSVKDREYTLEVDEEREGGGNEEVDDYELIESNIRDLEFRLLGGSKELKASAQNSGVLTNRQMTMLKVILCSGLYPHVAIADEHNSFKSESEKVYHTKNKLFVLLHPTSVFATNSEALQLSASDIVELKDIEMEGRRVSVRDEKGVWSTKHELLTYVNLIETTKPYLTGLLRVPALQAALLFSSSIDTNADLTRIVCDDWIEFRISSSKDAELMVSSVVRLRTTWQALIEQRLMVEEEGKEEREDGRRYERAQRLLSNKLSEFLYSSCSPYTMQRIHSTQLECLYRGNNESISTDTDTSQQHPLQNLLLTSQPHPVKGGIQVTEYLVYNSLCTDEVSAVYGEFSQYMQKYWTCEGCGESLLVTLSQRLEHEFTCQKNISASQHSQPNESETRPNDNVIRQNYHCSTCLTDFNFSNAEILKHRKHCKN